MPTQDPITNAVWLLIVGAMWGCTNPLIKRGGEGVSKIKKASKVNQFLAENWFLLSRWQYVIPFAINLSGSVMYYLALGNSDISFVVPVTNSITFLFTTFTSKLLGEKGTNMYTYIGMLFVLVGVSICVHSQLQTSQI